MQWEKKGIIASPDYNCGFGNTRIMIPSPIQVEEKILRIFCGFCDRNGISRVGFYDVRIDKPSHILKVSKKPVFDLGRDGSFDDNGVVPLSIIKVKKELYMYYVGFQKGVKIPYYMFGGLAISMNNGLNFERYSESPILDRVESEIYARCGMNVLIHDNKFMMWYIGSYGEGWARKKDKLVPQYIMRYIESEDGIHWVGSGKICMNYKSEDEHGFGRPFVFHNNGIFKQYYSIRTLSKGYKLGYAESSDGIQWNRQDERVGIFCSDTGWDSQNICYASLFQYNDITYMFYNGNNMGDTGFGYAIKRNT